MTACMFCKEICSENIYNVFLPHGDTFHTIKDDISEFIGINVEVYLKTGDCVCQNCKDAFSIIVDLKKRTFNFLNNNLNNNAGINEPLNFSRFCNLQVWEDDAMLNKSRETPELLAVKYSTPYKSQIEKNFAKREYYRSLDRQNYTHRFVANSRINIIDDEIQRAFRTEVKNTGRKRSYSTCSRHNRPRPTSEASVKIRSVSAIPNSEHVVKKRGRKKKGLAKKIEDNKPRLSCHMRKCKETYKDVDNLTWHLVTEHNLIALYFCDECNEKCVKKKHLKIHEEQTHIIVSTLCFLCGAEVKDLDELQKHLTKHSKSSFPCSYCDMSFLNKRALNKHTKESHTGKNEPLRVEPISCIKGKHVYKLDDEDRKLTSQKKCKEKEYTEIILGMDTSNSEV